MHAGLYSWFPKVVAYRPDFCMVCRQATRSVQKRTFDVMHIWWVPAVPFGFIWRWYCTRCHKDPRFTGKTPQGMRRLGTAVLAFLTVALTFDLPTKSSAQDFVFLWTVWVALLIGTFVALFVTLKPGDDVNLQRELRALKEETGPMCGLCESPLVFSGGDTRCSVCRVRRLPPPRFGSFLGVLWDRRKDEGDFS